MELLTHQQVERVANAVQGTTKEPLEALRGLSAQLAALRKGNPHASDDELREVAENVVLKLVTIARQAKERQRQFGSPNMQASYDIPQGTLHGGHRHMRIGRMLNVD
jgi:citrate synthase